MQRYRNQQCGQAIVEFLVYMAWMVPFVLLAIAIGHMLNIQSTAHEASRYVAWERLAYTGEDYDRLLRDEVNGLNAEVTDRFFVNGAKGFGGDLLVDENSRWDDWRSSRSMVDLVQGVTFELPNKAGDDETDQDMGPNSSRMTESYQNINSVVNRGTNEAQMMDGRGGIQANSTELLNLTVPIDASEDTALGLVRNLTEPKLSSSYALIADSWTPGTENVFNERVVDSRPSGLSRARQWLLNNGGARLLRNSFAEIDQRLYSDPNNAANSFSSVSPVQSTALPADLESYPEP